MMAMKMIMVGDNDDYDNTTTLLSLYGSIIQFTIYLQKTKQKQTTTKHKWTANHAVGPREFSFDSVYGHKAALVCVLASWAQQLQDPRMSSVNSLCKIRRCQKLAHS